MRQALPLSPQTANAPRGKAERRAAPRAPPLMVVMLSDGIAGRIFAYLTLQDARALAEAAAVCAGQASRLMLHTGFWAARGRAAQGQGMVDFIASATRRLAPMQLKTAMLNLEDTLRSDEDEAEGRLFPWFCLLEQPRALSRTLGYLVHKSTALWRPSDLASLFLAFHPDDGGLPQDETEAGVLAAELVHFCRGARLCGRGGPLSLANVLQAVLQAEDSDHRWAAEPKAAFVAHLLLSDEPPPGTAHFDLGEVVALGARLGLTGEDLEALTKLVAGLLACSAEAEAIAPPESTAGEIGEEKSSSHRRGHTEWTGIPGHGDAGGVVFYHERMTLDRMAATWLCDAVDAPAASGAGIGAAASSLVVKEHVAADSFMKDDFVWA